MHEQELGIVDGNGASVADKVQDDVGVGILPC